MKINGSPVQTTQETRTNRGDGSRGQARSESSQSTGGGSTADVKISAGGQLRQTAQQILDATPDVDSAKVSRIKAAIENGTYHIDPDKVASAFLKIESDLFD